MLQRANQQASGPAQQPANSNSAPPLTINPTQPLPQISGGETGAASDVSNRAEPKTTLAPTDREGLRKAAIVIKKVSWCCSTQALPEDMPRVHSNAGEARLPGAVSENDWFRFQADAETFLKTPELSLLEKQMPFSRRTLSDWRAGRSRPHRKGWERIGVILRKLGRLR